MSIEYIKEKTPRATRVECRLKVLRGLNSSVASPSGNTAIFICREDP